jgi:hypothetical protein
VYVPAGLLKPNHLPPSSLSRSEDTYGGGLDVNKLELWRVRVEQTISSPFLLMGKRVSADRGHPCSGFLFIVVQCMRGCVIRSVSGHKPEGRHA